MALEKAFGNQPLRYYAHLESESESESVYCQVGLHLPGIFLDI